MNKTFWSRFVVSSLLVLGLAAHAVAGTVTLKVNNPSLSTVKITGSKASGNPASSTSSVVSFFALTGDNITITATPKVGQISCDVKPKSFSSITQSATATVLCTPKKYSVTVSNPKNASFKLSGSSAYNANNPDSKSNSVFYVNHGDKISLSATKSGYACSVVPASVASAVANSTATVNCTPNKYTIKVTNPQLAAVVISGSTGANTVNPSSTASITFNVNSGDSVSLRATKPGYSCELTQDGELIEGIFSNVVANVPVPVSVECEQIPKYTVSVSNPSGAAVKIWDSSVPNAVNPNSAVSSKFYVGVEDSVYISATKAGYNCSVTDGNDNYGFFGLILEDFSVTVSCQAVSKYTIKVSNPSLASVRMLTKKEGTVTGPTAANSAVSMTFTAYQEERVFLAMSKTGQVCETESDSYSVNGSVIYQSADPTSPSFEPVINVTIVCNPDSSSHTIGGKVLGLGGKSGLTLMFCYSYDDFAPDTPRYCGVKNILGSATSYTFDQRFPEGVSYFVSIGIPGSSLSGQPTGISCSLVGSSDDYYDDVVSSEDETELHVTCGAPIEVQVTGLFDTDNASIYVINEWSFGSVEDIDAEVFGWYQDEYDTYSYTYIGEGTLPTRMPIGAKYAIDVEGELPPGYACGVSQNGRGTVTATGTIRVLVNCSLAVSINVTNPDQADVTISGSTIYPYSTRTDSSDLIAFAAREGDSITLTASLDGFECEVSQGSIPNIYDPQDVYVSCYGEGGSSSSYSYSYSSASSFAYSSASSFAYSSASSFAYSSASSFAYSSASSFAYSSASSFAYSSASSFAYSSASSLSSATSSSGYMVTTLAGSGGSGYLNGIGISASFNDPSGVAVDTLGNTYVADGNNHVIRKITSTGSVTTLAGSGTWAYADGVGQAASFGYPEDVAVDSAGNVYVADGYLHRIRKITPAGVVSTLAGSGSIGAVNAAGATASFYHPSGVAVDSAGNVYVADTYNNLIRKITPTGVVTTLAGSGLQSFADGTGVSASFSQPLGIAVDASGNVYVADSGNQRIRKITSAGVVTTLAGSGIWGSDDGNGSIASFAYPGDVAVDSLGNVFVADTYSQRIRMITSTGVVTTLAGSLSGFADGAGAVALFNYPDSIAVDASGNLYVADRTNHRVRKITTISSSSSSSYSSSFSSSSSSSSAATSYTVSGTVVGLGSGKSLVLQNNGANNKTVAYPTNSFVFPSQSSGSGYNVTVLTQPTGQFCSVLNGYGTVSSNITNVLVTCSAQTYTIGGNVYGLAAGKQVVLSINGVSPITMTTNGVFTWNGDAIISGYNYSVTVSTQPLGQTCIPSYGQGIVGTTNVTNIQINCSNNPFTIGGSVNGLSGTLILNNNGGDSKTIISNGSFSFPSTVSSGSSYNVTVVSQPTGQLCSVLNGSGVAYASVYTVSVSCVTNNIAPVANAGPDQNTVVVGGTVYLDGGYSYDLDGDSLGYEWSWVSAPSGSYATLYGTNNPYPYFTPDLPGVYQLRLQVNDGKTTSSYDYVSVTAFKEGLYANNGTYLGCLECATTNSDSICNYYGTYGYPYNSNSIWNSYGAYSSEYSSYSPWYYYASTPPLWVRSSGVVEYVTTNPYKSGRTTNTSVLNVLTTYSNNYYYYSHDYSLSVARGSVCGY